MRLAADSDPERHLAGVTLLFTPVEAQEVVDALMDLLDHRDPSLHHHVSAVDHQTEVTVALEIDK